MNNYESALKQHEANEVLEPYESGIKKEFMEAESLRITDELRLYLKTQGYSDYHREPRRSYESADAYRQRISGIAKRQLEISQGEQRSKVSEAFIRDPKSLNERGNHYGKEVLQLVVNEVCQKLENFVFASKSGLSTEEQEQLKVMVKNYLKKAGEATLLQLLHAFAKESGEVLLEDLFSQEEFARLLSFIITTPAENLEFTEEDFARLGAPLTGKVYNSEPPLIGTLFWHRKYLQAGLVRKKIKIIQSLQKKMSDTRPSSKLEDVLTQELELVGLAIQKSPVVKETGDRSRFMEIARQVSEGHTEAEKIKSLLAYDYEQAWNEQRGSLQVGVVIKLRHDIEEAFKDIPMSESGSYRGIIPYGVIGKLDEYVVKDHYKAIENAVKDLAHNKGIVTFRIKLRELLSQLREYSGVLQTAKPEFEMNRNSTGYPSLTKEQRQIDANLPAHIEALEKLETFCAETIGTLTQVIDTALERLKEESQKTNVTLQDLAQIIELGDDGEISYDGEISSGDMAIKRKRLSS